MSAGAELERMGGCSSDEFFASWCSLSELQPSPCVGAQKENLEGKQKKTRHNAATNERRETVCCNSAGSARAVAGRSSAKICCNGESYGIQTRSGIQQHSVGLLCGSKHRRDNRSF